MVECSYAAVVPASFLAACFLGYLGAKRWLDTCAIERHKKEIAIGTVRALSDSDDRRFMLHVFRAGYERMRSSDRSIPEYELNQLVEAYLSGIGVDEFLPTDFERARRLIAASMHKSIVLEAPHA